MPEKNYRAEVVDCLTRYGGLDDATARQKVSELELPVERERWVPCQPLPYVRAMELLHGHERPGWREDGALWPPPGDYFERMDRPPR